MTETLDETDQEHAGASGQRLGRAKTETDDGEDEQNKSGPDSRRVNRSRRASKMKSGSRRTYARPERRVEEQRTGRSVAVRPEERGTARTKRRRRGPGRAPRGGERCGAEEEGRRSGPDKGCAFIAGAEAVAAVGALSFAEMAWRGGGNRRKVELVGS